MDFLKLEYEIKKHGYSIGEFAEKVGISRAAFYRKCRGKTEFTLADMNKILKALDLDTPIGIFFAAEVS